MPIVVRSDDVRSKWNKGEILSGSGAVSTGHQWINTDLHNCTLQKRVAYILPHFADGMYAQIAIARHTEG